MVMEWLRCKNLLRSELVLPVTLVAVECIDVVASTVTKAAMNNGMSNLVLVTYDNILATLIFLPFNFHRKPAPLTFCLLCKFFLISLMGSSLGLLVTTGIKFSSPTLSAAIRNLVPIFTYLLAVLSRLEDPNLRSLAGVAKLLGAIVAVLGAITVSVYKGQQVFKSSSSSSSMKLHQLFLSEHSSWAIGGLILAIKSLVQSCLSIFKTTVIKEYPDKATVLLFTTFFSTIISGSFSIIMERDPEAWKLKADIGLIAIICSALFGRVFREGVHTWGYQKKGPVYVDMFKPLGIVIAMVMGVLFLSESLYLGRVIGAVIITIGFYAVIWGKSQEQKRLPGRICCLESSPERIPLLQNRRNAKGQT